MPRGRPVRRLPPELLTSDEVPALSSACPDHSPAGLRNRALILVLYRAGLEHVQRWLAVRAELGVGDADPVFCLVDGKPMTSSYVRVLLPRLGRRAGILRRIHAYGFRPTHAAELREESVEIGVISKQLGHLSIATTARYLDQIAPWDVVAAMGRRSW